MKDTVYIVSRPVYIDPYELPLGVFPSLRSACRFAGVDHGHASRLLSSSNLAIIRDYQIERVDITPGWKIILGK